jgi:putative hydrolase of the HAD superfamily
MKTYRHVFFDLDHTLWDFKSNSRLVFEQMYREYLVPEDPQLPVERALDRYEFLNASLWKELREGRRTKEEVRQLRFRLLLEEALPHLAHGERINLSEQMEVDFVRRTPRQKGLMPGAAHVVLALSQKYPLHIITNGFPESQVVKMECSGLKPFFKTVTTPEEVGAYKPAPVVFEAALQAAGAFPESSILIGDGWEADVLGAAAAGMDQVYYNPERVLPSTSYRPTHEVHHLRSLLDIL